MKGKLELKCEQVMSSKSFSAMWKGDLLGQTLVSKNDDVLLTGSVDELLPESKKIVGIYFSALWCPPCEQFLKDLIIFYENMKDSNSDFEIVFISSDKDEASFAECKSK